VEAAGYFVVSEALANVVKHAQASRATVVARLGEDLLEIEVRDDGVGGASAERGSGLRGLMDRVQALDGELLVDAAPAGGTTILARIPCPRSSIQEPAR
jgi:signal transduction histidine kinase